MQKLYTNHKRVTNQHNNIVLGNNLSQSPKDMRQDFSEKLRIKEIISDDLIQMFEKYYNRILLDHNINDYHMAEYTIKKIQNQWIEILEYTNQLHPLYKTCISNQIDQKIKEFHELPYKSSYKVIEHTIQKAKESWIDMKQYESLLPTLQKEWLIWTLHQKLKACIINDSTHNILWLRTYIKELIWLWIFVWHQSIKQDLNYTDLELYTLEEKNGILNNIHKHASTYKETQDINELDIVLEEIFLAEQLWIEINILQLAITLWLPIIDKASQEAYVNNLLDIFAQYIANPVDKQEKRKLSNLITILS